MTNSTRVRRSVVALIALATAAAACGGSGEEGEDSGGGTAAVSGEPGAVGIGDPYYPEIGNGGYDVEHYSISLSYDPARPDIVGETEITATATQDLSQFNLDLVALSVDSVEVDGEVAEWSRVDDEVVVTPDSSIGADRTFKTVVEYSGTPTPLEDDLSPVGLGWNRLEDGSTFVLSEPDGARTWFPSNDHPSDKATYDFAVTVPGDLEVAANGRLESNDSDTEGTRIWRWSMDEPMATYLAAVSMGGYEIEEAAGPAGVEIRNFFPPDIAETASYDFARTGEMLAYFTEIFGAYPFEEYGALVVPTALFSALENQTMSLFGEDFVSGDRTSEPVIAHELAHQWFGDNVTPEVWSDIWLNEGFATYAEFLWFDHDDPAFDLDATMVGLTSLELGPIGDPGPDDLFSQAVYIRGALTVHALRLTIGDEAFFDLLKRWNDVYAYSNATTADLIEMAEEISGLELDESFDAWLDAPEFPTLPTPDSGT